MANTVRIRNGMSNATEGDILGNFGDLVGVGVVDKANGHLLVTQDSPLGMNIQVAGGIVYVPNASYNQLDSDTPKFYPVVCEPEALAIDNNVSGQTRNDIVCVKVDKSIMPDADASNIATKVIVKGTPGGGTPTTPANHYKLAEIEVVNGETEIENSMITDTREQITLQERLINLTGDIVGTTDTQTLTNKTLTAPALTSPTMSGTWDGWISAGETWTYASADDPTYTFTVAADVTTKYSVGMKIKLTQGTVKYFIITAVSTYSGGNTTITVYGGTDYDLASSAISANAYSMMKSPQGFPMSPAKWRIFVQDDTRAVSSAGGWVNPIPALNVTIPIGIWNIYVRVKIEHRPDAPGRRFLGLSFSTANNAINGLLSALHILYAGGSGSDYNIRFVSEVAGILFLTSKTTYYTIVSGDGVQTGIDGREGYYSIVSVVSAYL